MLVRRLLLHRSKARPGTGGGTRLALRHDRCSGSTGGLHRRWYRWGAAVAPSGGAVPGLAVAWVGRVGADADVVDDTGGAGPGVGGLASPAGAVGRAGTAGAGGGGPQRGGLRGRRDLDGGMVGGCDRVDPAGVLSRGPAGARP